MNSMPDLTKSKYELPKVNHQKLLEYVCKAQDLSILKPDDFNDYVFRLLVRECKSRLASEIEKDIMSRFKNIFKF